MESDSCPDYMLKLELLISMSSGVNLETPYSLKQPEENLWRMRYHPQGLLLVPHGSEDGSVVLGANMPARAELLLGEEEKQMFHEVYDSILYLGIIEMLQIEMLQEAKVNFLGSLSRSNLVKLLGYCYEGKELLLVYEFMQRCSFENHLFGSKNPSLNVSHEIVSNIVLLGLQDLIEGVMIHVQI
ncbi:hypothetical protein L1987_58995 [Smallanthus sonchifolius]|uniref:Uncharacterized protein n=1 Tax=Smallanthus sonchifolius TaxID=185202 RepID=A0ACB9D3Z1_9ASTR|nr:hypothetical protein L1987_58995 [Smallanthus sonchifolius]